MSKSIAIAVLCSYVGHARAQTPEDAAAKAEAARHGAEKAQEGAEKAEEGAMSAAARALAAQKAVESAARTAPPAEPDSGFETVDLFGTANLISGSLTGEDGESFSTGGIGVAARSDGLTFSFAVAFGSSAISSSNVTKDEYAKFLLAPSSAVGLQAQVRRLWKVSDRGLWMGGSLGVKVNGHAFTYADTQTQPIGMFSVDPAVTASLKLSKKRSMEVFADIGLSMRFLTKPDEAFVDALGLKSNANKFYGLRVLSAFQIGNIYVGVEATKFDAFGDKAFVEFTDFSVLPYIGFRTGFGLEPFTEQEAITECARAAGKSAKARSTPSPTPVF